MKVDDIVGAYHLVATIGRGGMGIVFKARDLRTGDHVAIKTVRSPDERLVHGLRREKAALARLNHPGVVRLLDSGDFETLPWYAMELLEGQTLREAASERAAGMGTAVLPTQPAALTVPADAESGAFVPTDSFGVEDDDFDTSVDRPSMDRAGGGSLLAVLGMVHSVCAPLAYLHGEGLVHRDLKPDNVVLRPGGQAVLVDFGLLSHFAGIDGRDALSVDPRSHGTLSYLAPEIIRGEAADARADLYALGCILYELVTGRVPFRSKSTGAVLYKHVESEPVPPSARVSEVPAALDALILRLLAKHPQERFGYADDVSRALEALGVPPSTRTTQPPRSYLYRPRLAGRATETNAGRLWLSRRPLQGVALVEGEAGMGKTRMLVELAVEASRRGASVITLDHSAPGEMGGVHALHPIGIALADRCRLGGPERAGALLGPDAALLATLMPELESIVGPKAPVSLPPGTKRRRAALALAHALATWGEGRSTLLVADDLQWAGDGLVSLLEVLAQSPVEGVAVVGALRSGSLPEAIASIRSLCAVVPVGAVDENAVRQMTSDMLGMVSPPADLVRFLTERSEGVPMFVVETLRAVVAEGLVVRDKRGRWRVAMKALDATYGALASVRSPATMLALATSRVDSLTSNARAIAAIIAAFGRSATRPDMAAVADSRGISSSQVAAAVDELAARGVIVDGREDVRFAHANLRDAAWVGVSSEERVAVHAAIALRLAAARGDDSSGNAEAIGWQFEQAGNGAQAAAWYARAGERALSAGALADAERIVRSRLRIGRRADQVAWRARLASDVLCPRGRTAEALDVLDEARELPDLTIAETLLLAEATAEITSQVGRLDDAQAALAEALALLSMSPDSAAEARVRGRLGALLLSAGLHAAAESELKRSARLARAASATAVMARAWTGLAALALGRERVLEAAALAQRALRTLRDTSDRAAVADALRVLGVARARAGRLEDGLSLLEESVLAASEDAVREGMARSDRAEVLQRSGDPLRAIAEHGRALACLREAGHHRSHAEALVRAADAHRLAGELRPAIGLYDQATLLADVVGHERVALTARVAAAEAIRLTDPTDAARRARRARIDGERLGNGPLLARATVVLAEVAPIEAEPFLARARQLAHHAGDRVLVARIDLAAGVDAMDVLTRAVAEEAWALAADALSRLGRGAEAAAIRSAM